MRYVDLTKGRISFDQLPDEIQKSVEEKFGKKKYVLAAMVKNIPFKWKDQEAFVMPSVDWDLNEDSIETHFFGLKEVLSYGIFSGPTATIYTKTDEKAYIISQYLSSKDVSVIMVGNYFMNALNEKNVNKIYK